MKFISEIEDVAVNLKTLERYLNGSNQEERLFAHDLVRRGKTILVYKVNGVNHFAPSRFCGYLNNTMNQHIVNDEKDGRETNPEIDSLIGKAFSNETIEMKFLAYCAELGLEPHNNKRRYWRVPGVESRYLDLAI
jgi:hypothetical protein